MTARLRQAAPIAIGLALFLGALMMLRIELRTLSWNDLVTDVLAVPHHQLVLAVLLTALNYAALTGYDLLAFVYAQQRLSRWRIAAASLVAFALSNAIGFAVLTGPSVRYRFYSRWGVSGEQLSRIVVACSVTFWLGLFALGGASLVATGDALALPAAAHALIAPAGWLLLLVPFGYVTAAALNLRPIRVFGLALPLPPVRLAAAQLTLSSIDWALAAGVLYVLLPPGAPPFISFLGLFLIAILAGMISHVPGGIGVFEGLMLLLLAPNLPAAQLIPRLVVFRVLYYLAPLCAALAALIIDEAWQRRAGVTRVAAGAGRVSAQLAPTAMATLTFLAGVVLLVSGATPAAPGRLASVSGVLPLGIIEASHFAGSVAGAALLVLSQGLARRLDAAFYLTAGAIVAGMAASLLKGFD